MTKLEYIQPHSDVHSSRSGGKSAPARVDNLESLLHQIGDARVVVLEDPGNKGAPAFRALRTRITRALIAEMGFNLIAVDCDWPDAARIDHYVRNAAYAPATALPFTHGPARLWRTPDARATMDWLRDHNATLRLKARVPVYGLDLYSHARATRLVLRQLKRRDKTPLTLRICESTILRKLHEALADLRRAAEHDSARFLDGAQTARLMANAASIYRAMYYGLPEHAEMRNGHMFETLQTLLRYGGPNCKAVVWAQAPRGGDSAGQHAALHPADKALSLGELCAAAYGDLACRVSAAA